MKKDKKHAQSYIEADRKVREMSDGVSLEEVLLMISDAGNFQFTQDTKINCLNKESKTYLFKYLRTQKLIKITDDKWYSVSDEVGGCGLGSFIYHNFKRDDDHHQDAIDRFYVWWQNVVFNLDGKSKSRKEPLTIYNPELLGWLPRDTLSTLEFPFFSLRVNRKDTQIRKFTNQDNKYADQNNVIELTVIPSALGCMTIFDKEVLIYAFSLAVELNKRNKPYQTVRFSIADLLDALQLSQNGINYKRVKDGLNRLVGSIVNTNIKTGGIQLEKGFALISEWTIIRREPNNSRSKMIGIEIKLSDWILRSIKEHHLIALNPCYFQLKPFDRRLYEIIRKHCGHSNNWHISLDKLYKKFGSSMSLKSFKCKLLKLCTQKKLLEYEIRYSDFQNSLIVRKS